MREGIPTEYKHYRFRSRLEAIWARFFDLVGWPWKYEPFDYDGYIPDFVLLLPAGHVLVEVKPELSIEDLEIHQEKLDSCPWKKEAIILGVGLLGDRMDGYWKLGILRELHYDVTDEGTVRNSEHIGYWGPCNLHWCDVHGHTGFHSQDGGWSCRHGTGCDHHQYSPWPELFSKQWATAQNLVQWAPQTFGTR